MDTTTLADDPAAATDTPPTWSERITRRLVSPGVGPVDVDSLDVTDAEAGVRTERADETTTDDALSHERGGRPHSEPPELDHRWLLVAPLVGAVVLSTVSVLVDPNPLRTGTSPSGLLAFAVLIPFFALCVAGTLALVRDAARLRDVDAEWSPNPWHYLAPSAVTLAALHASRVVWSSGQPEELVGLVVGTLVVALVASSILAGPAYLLQRHRLHGDR